MKWSEFKEVVESQIDELDLDDPEIDFIDVYDLHDCDVIDNGNNQISIS